MWKKFFLDTIFPQFCLGCGKEGSIICEDCLSLIEISEFVYCPFCKTPKRVFGESLFTNSQERVSNGSTETSKRFQYRGTCPSHQKMKLSGVFSATSYKNPLVQNLIKKFKYEPFLKTLASPLAYLIISHFLLTENKIIFKDQFNSLLVPVPLLSSKKRDRGFNQSEEIAQKLSSFFKIPFLTNNLIKIKKTQPQVELKRQGREENIKGAFRIENPQEIQGKRIFLIDDIFTTGSTMEECARVLKQAGAREVWGIVVAREPLE